MSDYFHKYQKYKKKYNNYKKKMIQQSKNYTGEKLMTLYELDNYFGNKYRFYHLYRTDYIELRNFVRYITKSFGIDGYINLKKIFSDQITDANFYKILRKNYHKNVEQILTYQKEIYESKIPKKAESIYQLIDQLNLFPNRCNQMLDIGTESTEFLLEFEKKVRCEVIGSNISSGFSHYASYEEAIQSGKIVLYDGIHFPFNDNQFDLSTIVMVIHHVDKLEEFMKDVCRISKNIYIKDDDITNDRSKYIQEIQHELYDGVLVPNKPYPINSLTNKQIIDILERNNFRIIYNKINEYLTRPFVLIATKNE